MSCELCMGFYREAGSRDGERVARAFRVKCCPRREAAADDFNQEATIAPLSPSRITSQHITSLQVSLCPSLQRHLLPREYLRNPWRPRPTMPRGFLDVFPREIRDQIYTYVLASSSSAVTLSPWTIEVTRSMTILRTCKQIQRECKEIIWSHNGLSLRSPTQISARFSELMEVDDLRRIQHIEICLELLDKDDLEWIASGLKALARLPRIGALRSISLIAINDRPRSIKEYEEELDLMCSGEYVDGRLFGGGSDDNGNNLIFKTSWPHFSHWGKQKWLREMLMDRSDTTTVLKELHETFGGHLFVDGFLCFRNGKQLAKTSSLNPRDGEVKIVPR